MGRVALFFLCVVTLMACGDVSRAPVVSHSPRPRVSNTVPSNSPINAADCSLTNAWPEASSAQEKTLVTLLNRLRRKGVDCGEGAGWREPVADVLYDDKLSCAARLHSLDMSARNYVDHASPEGARVGVRVRSTGFVYSEVGENIAEGFTSAEDVLQAWLESPGHCENMMAGVHSHVGVGTAQGKAGTLWTLILAKPAPEAPGPF